MVNKMMLVILSVSLLLSSVSGIPTPQFFGYQQSTNPVSNLVSQGFHGIQNSLQNVLQGFQRPSFPQGGLFNSYRPESQISNQASIVQPNPIPNGPYGNVPNPNGVNLPIQSIQTVPVQPIYYETSVIPSPPNAPWPYRQIDSNDHQSQAYRWLPLPLFSHFNEPFIIIISRPPKPTIPQSAIPLSVTTSNPSESNTNTTSSSELSQNLSSTMPTTGLI